MPELRTSAFLVYFVVLLILVKKLLPLFIWWFCLSCLWGIYRLFGLPESVSEVIAKPLIWVGTTLLFFRWKKIPQAVSADLRKNYLTTKPFAQIFVLPLLFIVGYFFLVNFQSLHKISWDWSLLGLGLVVNFSTGIVEEYIYRGVMYVWLLKQTDEISAFGIVQLLFLLGHLPTLLLRSESLEAGLIHAFFIVLIGALHTIIFRITKSLYASTLAHGVWNTLVYYFLIPVG